MKKSREIALAGISSALALMCVSASMFIQPMTLSFATLSAIFILLPLTKKSWMGSILSYIVVALCAFFIGGIIMSAPFIIFFGFYAVLQRAIEELFMPWVQKIASFKNKSENNSTVGVVLKYVFGYIVKLGYLQIALAILWFATSAIIPEFNFFGLEITLTYLIFALGAIPLFLLYDLMMKLVYKNLKFIINKKIPDSNKTTTSEDRLFDSSKDDNSDSTNDIVEIPENSEKDDFEDDFIL